MSQNIIDDQILNTSAKEPVNVKEKLPSSREAETFVNMSKPKVYQPNKDLILDLGGKQSELKSEDTTITEDADRIQQVLGENTEDAESLISSSTILMLSGFIFVIFLIIVIAQKSSMHIQNLEKELDNVKKGKINSLT